MRLLVVPQSLNSPSAEHNPVAPSFLPSFLPSVKPSFRQTFLSAFRPSVLLPTLTQLIQVSIKPNGDAVSATPGLEGLSDFHSESETVKSTAFVPVTLDGKATLVEGQAPYDIDRFKAWHMSPQYHGISHVSPTGRRRFRFSACRR